ncbi:MAG: hypothetical protein H6559_12700 [Lewinellaceae bacterium]|nr:hypothetical protein [Lewinellaceae bacterium]
MQQAIAIEKEALEAIIITNKQAREKLERGSGKAPGANGPYSQKTEVQLFKKCKLTHIPGQ